MSDEQIDMYNEVMGELLCQADAVSKTVLNAYNPLVKKEDNAKVLSGPQFTAPALEECAIFLKLNTRDKDNNKIYSNKPTLADRIILKIKSLFESHCDGCDLKYINKLDQEEAPFFTCFLCLQGSHNCSTLKQLYDTSNQCVGQKDGIVWLCKRCRTKHDLLAPNKKRKGQGTVASDDSTTCTQTSRSSSPTPSIIEDSTSIPTIIEDSTSTPIIIEDDDQNLVTNNNDDSVEIEGEASNTSKKKDATTLTTVYEVLPKRVCKLYTQLKCPHGLTGKRHIDGKPCPDSHPPRCFRYCKFGSKHKKGCKKKSSECKYYHPVLCKFSVSRRICTNLDCTFTHLLGTKRYDQQHKQAAQDSQKQKESIKYNDPTSLFKRQQMSMKDTPRNPGTCDHTERTENPFLETRLKLMEDQLKDIKSLLHPPQQPQPWNVSPVINEPLYQVPTFPQLPFPQLPIPNPLPQPQLNNLWNSTIPQQSQNNPITMPLQFQNNQIPLLNNLPSSY